METAAAAGAAIPAAGKFSPVDLERHFNASSAAFGPRGPARQMGNRASGRDGLVRTPAGRIEMQGIPFLLGGEDVQKKSWVALSARPLPWAAQRVEIPIGQKAAYLCLAQFCDWDPREGAQDDLDVTPQNGQILARAILVYEAGPEHAVQIRRRFEAAPPSVGYGHHCFCALPSNSWEPMKLTDPLDSGTEWGNAQKCTKPRIISPALLWIWALENPEPDRPVKALRLEAAAPDALVLCGLTLFHGHGHPLRRERKALYRITLPDSSQEEKDPDRWKVEVDLGVVVRTYFAGEFRGEAWLQEGIPGFGTRGRTGGNLLFAEIAASEGATLSVRDTEGGAKYDFELSHVAPGREQPALQGKSRVEVLEPQKVWLRGRVVDAATQRPTPVRLAFRSSEGRYIPPYGHRTEVNNAWFQDYGADVRLGDASFAYVDGSFEVELPVGDVFVELSKGYEYAAVRQKLSITPSQTELQLQIGRHADLRSKGWVSADTHVHFLSPSTAILEAQGEGLNLVNLLAAQWGDLYSNVGDLPHGPLVSSDKESMVWVGTENRQHLLGHIGLLGGRGAPVFPLSADGPNEAFLGDPLWSTLAEWADACRRREGVSIAVHFPNPLAEMPADIVLGKIDAVELYPGGPNAFRTPAFNDWYRYLNCGYRVTAAGGTDKMGAYTPVGCNRTYACIGNEEFSFANWAKAVRQGQTFATSGPLLLFECDGRMPGDDIMLKAGGGTVEVKAEALSSFPLDRLEVVWNGRVMASRQDNAGTRRMVLSEKIAIPGPGWLAARCSAKLDGRIAKPFGCAAHTSPVYLRVPGQDLFSAPAVTYMLTLVEGARSYVETLATRPDRERFAQILAVLEQARKHLHQRLHDHGVAHS